MKPDVGNRAKASVITIGQGGRGFIIEGPHSERFVVTAAHCLRKLPRPKISDSEDRFYRLLAAPGKKARIMVECLFADPISDVAVLGAPDNQATPDDADAYQTLIVAATTIPINYAPPTELDGSTAWVLMLDGEWAPCLVQCYKDGRLRLEAAAEGVIVGGMSGSPILARDGSAIGVISRSDSSGKFGGPNPQLSRNLPGWLVCMSDGQPAAVSAPVSSNKGTMP
jgi:hypothetical protein